jgi:Bacterial sugar transferase
MACALVAELEALEVRFDGGGFVPAGYFGFTVVLPLLWLGSLAIAGGYDRRFVGVGSEEFRKDLNAAVSLTAGIAIVSYAGITGLWQVSGRSDLAWDEAERLDVRYVENWSLALDLQILWKTLSAVVRGSGAY